MPPEPGAGVPLSVAVVFPLSTKVIPEGRGPVSVSAGTGEPTEVTRNEPAVPVVNVVALPEVMAGPSFTVRVKFCVAELAPLLALKVIG